MSKRHEFKLLGRVLGTATAWWIEDEYIVVEGFEPASDDVLIRSGSFSIHFLDGTIKRYSDAGEELSSLDLLSAIRGLA